MHDPEDMHSCCCLLRDATNTCTHDVNTNKPIREPNLDIGLEGGSLQIGRGGQPPMTTVAASSGYELYTANLSHSNTT